MSRLDEYESRRGPVKRRRGVFKGRTPQHKPPGAQANTRQIQMALKLMGGTTEKDKGAPFDDDIDFIGRP